MLRRLFWLSALAGLGYAVWRWVNQREGAYGPPADTGRSYTPPAVTTGPAALGPTPGADPSAGAPRRIPTRVHRGSPPAAAPRDEAPAEPTEPAPAGDAPDLQSLAAAATDAAGDLSTFVGEAAASAADDLSNLVGEAAEAAGDLSRLVGEAAEAPADLAELVGDAVVGEGGAVDLTPLVGPEASAGLTNINEADEAALVALPGIGPALARRIIAYRDEHGPFSTIEQLEAIQGIGSRNLDEFRHLVTV